MPPLSNRAPNDNKDPNPKQEKTVDYKTMIIGMLGLKPEATDEEITAAIEAQRAKMAALENQDVLPVEEKKKEEEKKDEGATLENEELKTEVKELKEDLANRDIAEFAAVIPEGMAVSIKSQLLNNRVETRKFLEGFMKTASARATPLHNRNDAKPPDGTALTLNNSQAQNHAVKLIQNRDKCDFQSAWDIARTEKPTLFPSE